MAKLSLRQKEELRLIYINKHSDLLWFIAYGVGGVCLRKYLLNLFDNYTNRELIMILNELESVGFIEFLTHERHSLIKAKMVLYDFMELSSEQLANKERVFKQVNDSTGNIERSILICDYYLELKKTSSIDDIVKHIKEKSNLYFLDKYSSVKLLDFLKLITKNKMLVNEMNKHITVIKERYNRVLKGVEIKQKGNQLKQADKEKAKEERERLKVESIENKKARTLQKNNNKNKTTLYDELLQKGVITQLEYESWEDFETLKSKNIFFEKIRRVSKDKNVYNISFVVFLKPSANTKTVYKGLQSATKLVENLFLGLNVVVSFKLVSFNFTDRRLAELNKYIRKDTNNLLRYKNATESNNIDFITLMLSDYSTIKDKPVENIKPVEPVSYEDDLI